MLKAATNTLRAQSKQVAEKMEDKCNGPDNNCARFIRDLADKTKLTTAPARKKKRSLAAEWASEPLWDGGSHESDTAAAGKNGGERDQSTG